jgi:hypothetical protein
MIGGETEAERDEDGARDGVERAADALALEDAARPRDRDAVGG